ncbi:hypothetical protein CERSUDRAFT_99480 [Gelatoporia subvermispora B]|uniref:Uncharacterized protein n=1 Tax=Ceriporiopsis subvermispora (strain B) TaxID=914234 RepID=M2R2D2_CERS8|nr:hypothetical protein CERSUDRAFT_99480 [Gelatoporia subvermispora B]
MGDLQMLWWRIREGAPALHRASYPGALDRSVWMPKSQIAAAFHARSHTPLRPFLFARPQVSNDPYILAGANASQGCAIPSG